MIDCYDELKSLTINDYKRCITEMKKAHPFMDDERMYVSRANPENYPYVVVVLDVDGTKITLERRVSHERTELGTAAEKRDKL